MKYLFYVLYFLVVGFVIYLFMYDCYKSWYFWILGFLISCVYIFGKFKVIIGDYLCFFGCICWFFWILI